MSQFCLVLIGRRENYDEPVAAALAAAFQQSMEWGRPVVSSAPIVLLEGLTEPQARAIHGALQQVEAAGSKFEVHRSGSQQIEGCSKLRWPTPPTIAGRSLEAYLGAGGAGGAPTAQIQCPHCGVQFQVSFNIIAAATPTSPRASNRQISPAMGSPTPNNMTSSGNYAPQPGFAPPAQPGPQTYGVAGVGTSSGFYALPGSNAMIGPAGAPTTSMGGPATPPPQNAPGSHLGVSPSQPLPKARSATPNPGQTAQPGMPPRPATPDRGQGRPSPMTGQRQLSPPAGQPQQSGRPQHQTPGTGSVPQRPHSGHYGRPEAGARPPIELPPARPLPSSGGPRPASQTGIPTLPPTGGSATPPGTPPNVKSLPALAPLGGPDNSDLQGPMSLDEFEAHVSGIHAPIEDPPDKSKQPPGNRRKSDRRR